MRHYEHNRSEGEEWSAFVERVGTAPDVGEGPEVSGGDDFEG